MMCADLVWSAHETLQGGGCGGRISPNPYTAVIVDGEASVVDGICSLCAKSGMVEVIGAAADGASGLALIESSQPQAVFIDVGVLGPLGPEFVAELKTWPRPPLIVFTAATERFAVTAFDLGAVDYMLKPLVPARISQAIDRVADMLAVDDPDPSSMFWVPYRDTVVRLMSREIDRFEAERDYVRLIAADRSFLVRATLTQMSRRIDPARFVRIHRSTIMATDRIVGLRHAGAGAWIAIDRDGATFPIGRSYLNSVRCHLGFPR